MGVDSGGAGGGVAPWDPDDPYYYTSGSRAYGSGSDGSGAIIGGDDEKSYASEVDQFSGSIGAIVEELKEWDPDRAFQLLT